MSTQSAKRTARLKITLNKRTVEALAPADKPFIAWDDKVTGFGCRVQPSGTKSFIVNYRAGEGGRRAANRRVVVGRYGRVTPERARRLAQELLGRVAAGEDPAGQRARARAMPTLGKAFEDYIAIGAGRRESTVQLYRNIVRLHLSDWLDRPLDSITRRDVEERFHRLSAESGWTSGNQVLTLLNSVFRRSCADIEELRNPVELWYAGGGRLHRKRRRQIPPPAEVLPKWRKGIEGAVRTPVVRDALWFGLYTGMRKGEVLGLRWEHVDIGAMTFRVEETKSGEPLVLPVTRQFAAILERRRAARDATCERTRPWVFPSATSASGRTGGLLHVNARIGEAGGARFWFHALRNCFITVADRDLMLPASLTKRLVNHARSGDVTEGYAAEWTMEQLRDTAQRIADRMDAMMHGEPGWESAREAAA